LPVSPNRPIPPPLRRASGRLSRTTGRFWERVGGSARAVTTAALPYYRRVVPVELRALIPDKLRRLLKWMLGVKDAIAQMYELKVSLNDLGFVERALEELDAFSEHEDVLAQRRANWVLAVWYANQRSPEGSAAALALLDRRSDDVVEPDVRRREILVRAECYATVGDMDAARAAIAAVLQDDPHPDLYLAEANLHEEPAERLAHVNKALRFHNLPELALGPEEDAALYDRLTVAGALPATNGPKVSVIIPAFNAAEHIATALEALISQTWKSTEILVVDDLSTDATPEIVSAFSERDPRIRLIRAEANRGSYVARNLALREVTGEFVTTHDSDDWSHPQKLEIQARHLMNNRGTIANMSQQARANSDLLFHRRGNPGFYIFDNMSSLMFRRNPVTRELGYWDSVRFGADSELIERMRVRFGRGAVSSLSDAGPLSFQRQLESSLTGSSVFGYHGFLMGARLAYHQASRSHHRRSGRLYYEFPQVERPFAVPEPMRPKREVAKSVRRPFDVILISDFRIPGKVEALAVERISEERSRALRVGLIQMAQYSYKPTAEILPQFRERESVGEVEFIVMGEHVSCERLVLLHPPVLESFQRFVPDVEAEEIEVLVEEMPSELTDPEALRRWLDACKSNARRYFGSAGVWSSTDASLGPLLAADRSSRKST